MNFILPKDKQAVLYILEACQTNVPLNLIGVPKYLHESDFISSRLLGKCLWLPATTCTL